MAKRLISALQEEAPPHSSAFIMNARVVLAQRGYVGVLVALVTFCGSLEKGLCKLEEARE